MPTPQEEPFIKPASAKLLFRDEGLGLLAWAKSDGRADFAALNYKANRDIESSSAANIASNRPADAFTRRSIANGRVMSAEFDQCLVLHRQSVEPLPGNKQARVTWNVFNPGNYIGLPASAVTPFAFDDVVEMRNDGTHKLTPGALAVADLDGLVNAAGSTNDEIIVVRETTNRDLKLEVFNFAWGEPGTSKGAAILLPNPLGYLPALNDPQRKPGVVIVKTGDFSGDGRRQILVVHHAGRRGKEDDTFVQAVVYDYAIRVEKEKSSCVGSLVLREQIEVTTALLNTGLDVAVGDFLGATGLRTVAGLKVGAGREQVAIACHQGAHAIGDGSYVSACLVFSFLDRDPSDATGKMAVRHTHRPPETWPDSNLAQGPRRQLFALSAGQYRLEPAKGYTLGRKQLGVAYSVLTQTTKTMPWDEVYSYNFVKAWGLSISAPNPGGDVSKPPVWAVDTYTWMQTDDTRSLIHQLDATAANIAYAKNATPTPVDCFVVASMTDNGPGGRAVVTLHRGSLDGDGGRAFPNHGYNEGYGSSFLGYDNGWNTGIAIAPYDSKGRSTMLGPPMRITLNELVTTTYVLQEPPKHMDYLPLDGEASELGIVNLSVDPRFNVTYTDKKGKEVSSSVTDGTANTFNQNNEISVGETVSMGDPKSPSFGIGISETVKFGYAYDEKESTYRSTAKTSTNTLTASTNSDDALSYAFRSVDIFRYRVLGRKTDDGKFVYVDVSVPREGEGSVPCDGSNMPEIYQPTHQNGNALTYPILSSALSARFLPRDIGSFERPDTATPGKTVTVTAPLSVPRRYFWNGNEESEEIAWSTTDVGSSSFEYSKTLSGSSDTTVSCEANCSCLIFNTTQTASFKNSTGGSHGWNKQTVNSSTSSSTQSLLLTKTKGDRTRGYSFQPVFYVTADGTLKMASATDFTQGVGKDWWADTYAGPDAALNLPYRFLRDGSGFNDLDNRRRIRGGFAFYATPSPVTKLLTPVTGSIKPGEKLILQVRVHNLSLGMPLGCDESGKPKPVRVRFDFVEVDLISRDEIGPRTTIGTVDVAFADWNLADPGDSPPIPAGTLIPPRGIGLASIGFDTANLPTDGSRHEYRIYAVVDPDDEIRWKRSGQIATQTHVRHTKSVVVRLRNTPEAGVKVRIALEAKDRASLGAVEHTSAGEGRSVILQALAQKLQELPAVKAGLHFDVSADRIIISRDNAALKPGSEYRSGVVAQDGSAVYFIPSVSGGSGGATAGNTIVISNDSPAQNKEGWFPITIMKPASPTGNSAAPPRLLLGPQALAIRNQTGRLVSDRVELDVNRYASFRLNVTATHDIEAGRWAEVYLGDPAKGGRLLGVAPVAGVAANVANYIWGDWLMPNTPGTFPVFVRLVGANEACQQPMTITLRS
jgi:hypothetical protein